MCQFHEALLLFLLSVSVWLILYYFLSEKRIKLGVTVRVCLFAIFLHSVGLFSVIRPALRMRHFKFVFDSFICMFPFGFHHLNEMRHCQFTNITVSLCVEYVLRDCCRLIHTQQCVRREMYNAMLSVYPYFLGKKSTKDSHLTLYLIHVEEYVCLCSFNNIFHNIICMSLMILRFIRSLHFTQLSY